MKKQKLIFTLLIGWALLLTSCSSLDSNSAKGITASGTISALSVNIGSELGGKVMNVNFNEGDSVNAGDVLFTLESDYLQSQMDQLKASVEAAEGQLSSAKLQMENAEIQLSLAIQGSRMQFQEALLNDLSRSQPGAFELPVWYFTRAENIRVAKEIITSSEKTLQDKAEKLEETLGGIVNQDFILIENELAMAQGEYTITDAALDRVSKASENKEMKDIAQKDFDLAESKLKEVQKRYDQMLNTDSAEDVLKARADVGAAQAKYDEAVDYLNSLYIGDDSLQVLTAQSAVKLAEMNVNQAESGLKQAQAALKSVEIQLDKMKIQSPITGSVLTRDIENGEMISAGRVVMTIGNIDQVFLTVYIPEDQYGRIKLDQEVIVTVDSFPDLTYKGVVNFISSEAEFTPSNVQTVEGRKATVFAVKIRIDNTQHDLKPGMPADVEFLF